MTAPDPLLGSLIGVVAVLTVKHYLADFLLQTPWIAHGKESVKDWPAPLALHVLWHGVLFLMVALVANPALWWLALVDVGIHAGIDLGKAAAARRGGWDPRQTPFWWLMGFDQMLHQLTNVGLAAALVLA